MAEQCSRVRKDGGTLSEPFSKTQDRLRDFEFQPELGNRIGNPKEYDNANMVLGQFAETKGPRAPVRNRGRSKK
ncbi:MAG: hypothetical protein NPIRA03_32120 [Nitrospirales bacterium]|nr:MAG: hypothetical protein NPIRA03_32120 [Nitrospirales bacterium]